MPTAVHDSHTVAVSGSVVDGHSAHGADSWRSANRSSSAVRRRRYGHAVVSVRASRSTSKATKWDGHVAEASTAPAPRRSRLGAPAARTPTPPTHHLCELFQV